MNSNYEYLKQKILELKASETIKRDAKIVKATGYSKGLISSYIGGKINPSNDFIEKFNQVYFPNNSKTFSILKTNLEAKGYSTEPPKVGKSQNDMINLNNASYISATFELLLEVLSAVTNEPLEQVKARAGQLVHEKGRKLEDFLNATLP